MFGSVKQSKKILVMNDAVMVKQIHCISLKHSIDILQPILSQILCKIDLSRFLIGKHKNHVTIRLQNIHPCFPNMKHFCLPYTSCKIVLGTLIIFFHGT